MKRPERKGNRQPDSQHIHHPKRSCFHVAQEVREMGDTEIADQLTRRLMPWARLRALGL